MLAFSLSLSVSLSLSLSLSISLSLSLSHTHKQDSYLVEYFNDLNTYLKTGSPVYFVVKEGFNYSLRSEQNKICSASDCDKASLGAQIYVHAQVPDK